MKLAALASTVILISLTALAGSPPVAPANFRLTRFASPSGSAANDGLSTNSPWSLSYALSQGGASTRITLLPGTYPSIEISLAGTMLVSQTKWAARVVGSPGAHGIWTDTNVANVTIDGIEVAGSALDGIHLNGSNSIVRHCWVHDSSGYGVSARRNPNTLIEGNLIERNGSAPAGGQGIALSGTNCIVRGNVIRYNQGWGCMAYEAPPASSAECDFYNNLVYGNGSGLVVWSPTGQTNYVFNNTIVSQTNNCLASYYGNLFVTNNILMGSATSPAISLFDGASVWADYNLVNASISTDGPHDVVTANPGFVNTGAGLYWLTASSPARGAANPVVIPPLDFFGKSESFVTDVGAFQYNNALANDTRILGPSATNGADYWAQVGGGGISPGITTQPQNQTVIAGQSATFVVAATGDAPLSFQWTFNGSNVGSTSSSYSRSNCQLADNGGQVQVTVSNGSGTARSATASLTVMSSGTPPAIAAQPQNQTVIVGQSATFGVAATGDAPLSYQWTFNGSNVGSTSSSYTRSNCQLGDNGGILLATVSNASGSVQSSSATLSVNPNGTYYYVSPTGNSGNTGLSTSSPWPLAYALNNYSGPGVTINLMDGLYNAGLQTTYGPNGQFQFHNTRCTPANPMTVRAVNKWKAIIAFGTTGGIGAATATGYATPGVIFDGLQVCSNLLDGIDICNNSIIRNCWVHDNSQQGINSSNGKCHDNLFEFNLLERNGTDPGFPYHYHNIYVYGANNTFRNNVSRWAGYGHGVQFYSEADSLTSETNNYIYNNLIYGNTNGGYGMDVYGGSYSTASSSIINPGTNYVFNNTILDSILCVGGTVCLTNNIILPSPGRAALQLGGNPSVLLSDYNLGTSTIHGDAHEVISTWSGLGFVNPSNGLYWLTSGSSAMGKAFAGLYGPVDFFGNSQSSITAIGAFQYSAALAGDTRVLDPSPNADYWSMP